VYVCVCVCVSDSASDMAMLAEEVCGCRAELLSGGMSGDNSTAILKHLADGQPVLIPDPLCSLTFRLFGRTHLL
jgi:hypothetical protein